MSCRILSINPGSTSTKVALYEDETPLFVESIAHLAGELDGFATLIEQLGFRQKTVEEALRKHGYHPEELAAVVGRGGMLPPVNAGGYLVNQAMLDELAGPQVRQHASNLGAMIAAGIAWPRGVPAYIYDAVASDEMPEIAKVTGVREIRRQSFCHVLNAKATARKVAKKLGGTYEAFNFIVAHIGGGISVSAHEKGRIIDVITDDAGPFSPERSGSIPLGYVIDMCYSGAYTKRELLDKFKRNGGIKGLLGTNDCLEVERMCESNPYARLVYEAEAYQIAKGIGELAPVLYGRVDAVILTGGLARSELMTSMIADRVRYLAPVEIVPGENEMESLTLGVLRILRGEEGYSVYAPARHTAQ